MRIENFNKLATVLCLCLTIIAATQCAKNIGGAAVNLPGDILGIEIGMSKADTDRRLQEIAVFERDERKRQQVWRVKDETRFSHVSVGYDQNDQVRYVTAFVDKAKAKERVRYADIGDLSTAKQEIIEPHRRYIWNVPARNEKPAYTIVLNGDEPEFVSIYSIAKAIDSPEKTEEEKKEKG